jgi:hypothetical protein
MNGRRLPLPTAAALALFALLATGCAQEPGDQAPTRCKSKTEVGVVVNKNRISVVVNPSKPDRKSYTTRGLTQKEYNSLREGGRYIRKYGCGPDTYRGQ